MRGFSNIDSLLDAIDKMDIYKKDYDTIMFLLENTTPKLFAKIIEEVLLGNLYWSDFEEALSKEYKDTIRGNLQQQKEFSQYIDRFIKFRKYISEDYEYDYKSGNLFMKNETGNEALNNFFTEEYNRFRNDILYNLTVEKKNDNVLSKALKLRLYNAIRNGEILISDPSSLGEGYTVEDDKIIYTDPLDPNNVIEYPYINPDDIFLFINSYILALDEQHQQLTEFDKAYMVENGLDEKTVKHFKALGILLRKKQASL